MKGIATYQSHAGIIQFTWSGTFEATPRRVSETRRILSALLNGCALAEDAVTCLSEVAANAVTHSNSRLPGGTFTVHATLAASRLRVEVKDEGGTWAPQPDTDDGHGRGLKIVQALAGGYTVSATQHARTVAFEMAIS